ncbi:MAG: hypothetical protein K2J82_03985 [Muribaculaceae bacterium]|nr:hypothetical protein [Muribaculaceae bacterium]
MPSRKGVAGVRQPSSAITADASRCCVGSGLLPPNRIGSFSPNGMFR